MSSLTAAGYIHGYIFKSLDRDRIFDLTNIEPTKQWVTIPELQ